jgi:putative aldouronate transport system permease protein
MRIFVPMSLPVIAALGLFAAVDHWNQWFDALIYIRRQNLMPLQLILRNLFANVNIGFDLNVQTTIESTQRVATVSIRMAVTVIGTLPILMVYPFLQKHFVKGVYVGAVKG